MSIVGKYSFPGLRKLNAAGIRRVLLLSPYTAWIVGVPFLSSFFTEILGAILANKGLVFVNIGASIVDGELDQKQFDAALDSAFSEIENIGGRDKLTAAQRKAIDDQVINAARKLIVFGRRH